MWVEKEIESEEPALLFAVALAEFTWPGPNFLDGFDGLEFSWLRPSTMVDLCDPKRGARSWVDRSSVMSADSKS